MKKQGSLILLLLALIFGSFCLGFFAGRNFTQAPIQVSALPKATEPSTTAATEAQTVSGRALIPSGETQPSSETAPLIAGETEPSSEAAPTDASEPQSTSDPATEPAPEPSSDATTEASTETTTEAPSETTSEPTVGSGLININTADQATLMTLPGIGEVLSQRIIDYRNAHGSFRSVSELLNVSGIGEKRLADILDYICTGG